MRTRIKHNSLSRIKASACFLVLILLTLTLSACDRDSSNRSISSSQTALNSNSSSHGFDSTIEINTTSDGSIYIYSQWANNLDIAGSDQEKAQFLVVDNSNPELFIEQPSISYPNGDLSFVSRKDAAGSATLYVFLDRQGDGNFSIDNLVVLTITLQSTELNLSPVFTVGRDIVTQSDAGKTFPQWISNAHDGNSSDQFLNFEITSNSGADLFNQQPTVSYPSGTLRFTPKTGAEGVATLTIRAKDNGGVANGGMDTSEEQSFTITLSLDGLNHAPSFDGGININTVADGRNFEQKAWASNAQDNDGNSQKLEFQTIHVEHPEYFEVQPWVSYPSQTLRFRAKKGMVGISTVSVLLEDNGGTAFGGVDHSGEFQFTIVLSQLKENHAPSFKVGEDIRIPVNYGAFTERAWACCALDNDNNTQALSFKIVENSAPQLFDVAPSISYPSHTLRFTPAAGATGFASIKAIIGDDGGTEFGGLDHSEPQSFVIEIYQPEANHAPRFSTGPDVTVANLSGAVALPAWAVNVADGDDETQALQFEIIANSNPDILLDSPTLSWPSRTLRFTTNPDNSGYTDITLVLKDNGGTQNGGSNRSLSQTFRITTTAPNTAPIVQNIDLKTDKNTPVLAAFKATDSESDPLLYSIANAPKNGVVKITDNSFSYTPNTDYLGSDSFSYLAFDGEDYSKPAIVTIDISQVVAGNTAPVASDITLNSLEDAIVEFQLSAFDADGDTLSYIITETANDSTVELIGDRVRLSPEADYSGPIAFKYKANDGQLDSNIASFSLTVTAVNDAPTATGATLQVLGATPLEHSLRGHDIDGDSLSFHIENPPTQGTASIIGGKLSYQANKGFVGTDTLTFTSNDGKQSSAPAVIEIRVIDNNHAPVASDISTIVDEDNVVTITLQGTDPDNDTLSYNINTQPSNGIIDRTADQVSYTPNADFNGTDSFEYEVSDGVESNTATVFITIKPVNDAPAITSMPRLKLAQNDVYHYALTATDIDADVLSFSLIDAPAGMLLDSKTNQITWSPDASQSGDFQATVEVSDPDKLVDTQSFSLTVNDYNYAPTAQDQTIELQEDEIKTITLLGDDADGDTLSYSIKSVPLRGSATVVADQLQYTPDENYHGSDSLTFIVSDGEKQSTAKITFTINPANDAPLITSTPGLSADQNSLYRYHIIATDPDTDLLTYELLSAPVGMVLDAASNTLNWTPDATQRGDFAVNVKVSDPLGLFAEQTFTINIDPGNRAPVAEAIAASLDEDSTIEVTLSASDIDGDSLSYQIVTPPLNGTANLNGQTLSYTPDANYHGPDTLTYAANDGEKLGSAEVSLTINPVNDAPEITSQAIELAEQTQEYQYTLSATDIDGDVLSFELITGPVGMTVDAASDKLLWTPGDSQSGDFPVTVRVKDPQGLYDEQIFGILVEQKNRAPVITSQPVTTGDTASPYQYAFSATDPDGDTLTYSLASGPASMTIDPGTGLVEWQPTEDYALPITTDENAFCYASDSSSNSNATSVDTAVLIDLSGSMTGEFIWSGQLIPSLEARYLNAGIGLANGNGYGLIGYEAIAYPKPVGGGDFGRYDEFVEETEKLRAFGGTEDGYIPIDHAINQYAFAPNSAKRLLLITDEDRDTVDHSLNYQNILESLTSTETNLAAIISVVLACESGEIALGMVSETTGIVETAGSNYATCKLLPVTSTPSYEHYGKLALENGGSVWSLYKLRQGGTTALAFSRALANLEVSDVLSNLPPVAQADLSISSTHYANSTLQVVVRNTGNAASTSNTLKVYSDTGLIKEVDIPALMEKETYTANIIISDIGSAGSQLKLALDTRNSDCLPENAEAVLPIIKLSVTDSNGISSTQHYIITSALSNTAPKITSTAPTKAAINVPYAYQVTVEDDRGDDHQFSLVNAPTGMIINPYSGLIQFKGNKNQQGSHTVTVNVEDLAGITVSQEYQLQLDTSTDVTGAGPYFKPSIDYFTFEKNQLIQYQAQAISSADLVLSYSLLLGPDYCSVDKQSGLVECLTGDGVPNHKWLYIRVEDQYGRGDLLSVAINKTPVWRTSFTLNDASYERQYTHHVSGSATDPDGDSLSYLLLDGPVGMMLTPPNKLEWLPPESFAETTIPVELQVTDTVGASTTKTFDLYIHRNRDPVFSGEPRDFFIVDRNYAFTLRASDADGDTLTYNYDSYPTGSTITNQSQQTIHWTQDQADIPSFEFKYSVDDGFGGFVEISKTVSVFHNRAPVWASDDAITISEGKPFAYTMKATDPDLDSVNYELISAPPGVTMSSSNRINWTPTQSQQGIHPITLKASDNYGGESEFILTITVGENQPPRITSTPVFSVVSNHPYYSKNTAVDDEKDNFQFSLQTAPEGMTTTAHNNGRISWTPRHDQIGKHDVTLVATDAYGAIRFQSFQVEVSPNHAPTPTFDAPSKAITGHNYYFYIYATDPDGDRPKIKLVSGPSGMTAPTTSGGRVYWTPMADQTGIHEATLSFYDDFGGETLKTFKVEVVANAKPTLTITSSSWPLVVGNASYLRYSVDDSDGDYVGIKLSPDSAAIDGLRIYSTYAYWTPTADQVGEHNFKLLLDDSRGGQTEYTINATVYDSLLFIQTPTDLVFESGAQTIASYKANHPEGLTVTYSLVTAPSDIRLNYNGSRIIWKPTDADIGLHQVTIEASTPDGQTATTTFDIDVIATNLAPLIDPIPDQIATAESQWTYQLVASDPEGKALTYKLYNRPVYSLAIDRDTGLISLTPTQNQVGEYTQKVTVTDDRNRYTYMEFKLRIIDRSNTPPVIDSNPKTHGLVDQLYSYTIEATDAENDTLSYALLSGPDGAVISNNTLSWTPSAIQSGTHSFTISVDDSFGPIEQSFSVDVAASNTGPVVEIVSPAYFDTVSNIIDIIGTVQDTELAQWRLQIKSASASDSDPWILLAEGNTEQTTASLVSFDPSLRFNGLYHLRLVAEDQFGATAEDNTTITLDGDLKVGNFSITLEDLSIPMAGIPIQVTRTYDTRQKEQSLSFGYGWSIDYQNAHLDASRVIGLNWELNTYASGPFGIIPNHCIESSRPPIVTVTLPNGDVEEFEATVSPKCNQVAPLFDVTIAFEAKGNTTSSLEVTGDASAKMINQQTLVETNTFSDPVNPSTFKLTTKTGYEYYFDKDFGIAKIIDPNGNSLVYSDNGIIHSSGKALRFYRDSEDRIVQILDPSGNTLNYSYNTDGDLTIAANREDENSSYTYNNSHGLIDMFDPLGRKLVKNIYNSEGRLIAQEDENGHQTEFQHDIAGRESVITDRLGRTTVFYYDDRGNVTSEVDAHGNTSQFSYDADDNQIGKIDALGHTTSATFDAEFNQLSTTDELGNVTHFAYNDFGQETKITDAKGNSYNNTYDAKGNLKTITDPMGNAYSNVVNAKGLVSTLTDPMGGATSFTYDSEGNKTTETNAEGHITSFTYTTNNQLASETRSRTVDGQLVTETQSYGYDKQDRLVKTAFYNGTTHETEYDLAGNISAEIDTNGRRTEMGYDAYNRLLKTTYPDASTASNTYDAEGNLLTDTNALGDITSYEYDGLNRAVKTIYADNSTHQTEFDTIGRVSRQTDARGNQTSYSYDAAGRRTQVTDAVGNITTTTFDKNGNETSVDDAKGNTTTYNYNALDQNIQTEFDDGSSIEAEYDALGRKTISIDQNARETHYAYNARGLLTSVTDALNQVTAYTYDEVGNKLSQTDAMGRTTLWTYDDMGRELTRTLPLGQTESHVYNSDGNRESHTDFNGNTHAFSYDTDTNRITSATYADGTTKTYQYNSIGQRSGATDDSGNYSYTYDALQRLLTETKPDGSLLTYTYDEEGNKTSLVSTVNGVDTHTNYTYDKLNRLETVVYATGTSTYTYDHNGNRNSLLHTNGNKTDYGYDSLNRLTSVLHTDSAGIELASFTYTLENTGRRIQITEGNGRTTDYSYDDLYRLTDEIISDTINGAYSANYEYDAVGNRLYDTVDGIQTSYHYDDNDRLLQQGTKIFTYDNNGNTLSETENNLSKNFQWNSENRLIGHNQSALQNTFSYDIDNNRVAKTTNNNGTLQAITYVVDNNQDYAQVIHEIDSDTSTVTASYTFGDDLLAQTRSGLTQTYHYDGLGSTRLLTDSSGQATDLYDYEAFGEVLNQAGSSDNDFLYTGEQFDAEVDQYYLRARYYDQGIGRFIGMDQWSGTKPTPTSVHKYLYADGSPSNLIDPTGYFSISSATTQLAISTTLTGYMTVSVLNSAGRSLSRADSKLPSAAFFSLVANAGIATVGGSAGVDIVVDFRTQRVWAYPVYGISITPGNLNNKKNSYSIGAMVGSIWNFNNPKDWRGGAASITVPGTVASYMGNFLSMGNVEIATALDQFGSFGDIVRGYSATIVSSGSAVGIGASKGGLVFSTSASYAQSPVEITGSHFRSAASSIKSNFGNAVNYIGKNLLQ